MLHRFPGARKSLRRCVWHAAAAAANTAATAAVPAAAAAASAPCCEPEHRFVFQDPGVKVEGGLGGNPELEEVEPQPLDITMPTDSCVRTITYFVLLPIVFPLWMTLPDTRKKSGEFQTFLTQNFQAPGEEEEEPQPLDLSWPETCRERITYVAFLPIIIPLWLTLPDTRKPSGAVIACVPLDCCASVAVSTYCTD